MKETLRDRLIREEGLRLFPYKDTKGIWTIGVGHNIEADPIMFPNLELLKSRGVTKDEAYALLDKDIRDHTAALIDALPWTGDLDWPRKSVMIDLCFNMGLGDEHRGLLSFKNTLAHMESGNWSDVAEHMRASKWYQDVGPARADILIKILETGDDA
jgi:lysozyme